MKFVRIALMSSIIAGAVVGCFAEGYPERNTAERRPPEKDAGSEPDVTETPDSEPPPDLVVNCPPSDGAEKLHARSAVMSEEVESTTRTVFVASLYEQFATNCKGCHIENNLGDFQVSAGSFPDRMTAQVIARMKSDDPSLFMPPLPVGKPWSERGDGDPIVQLVKGLEEWMAAGSPRDLYTVEIEGSGQSPYLLSTDVGSRLTNIGNCVPDKLLYVDPKSSDLDELFEKAERKPPGEGTLVERLGLPEHLDETDLFTFDSKALAEHGVIAYVPTYPLWSDGSGKLRHVRVPKGKSITYNKKTKQFDIPENTRFYKTFLKKVIDESGQESFRKIETRIIVSRPDKKLEDGTLEPTSLFGTYAWNDEETEATLVTDPLRNGEPFRDRLFTYVLDEPAAAEIYASDAPDKAAALAQAGIVRHYAIPGSERCVQCHMGSPSASFVLGFTPLQINKVSAGQSGVIESSGADELNQLERLVELKVISGFDPQKDAVRLEDSQGDRRPRNEYELVAQGYLLGNCSHCHNPHGYPTRINPQLGPVLDFLPSEKGGIFEFPLETMSPRLKRGANGNVPLPYITPSLRELVPDYAYDGTASTTWTPKFALVPFQSDRIAQHFSAPWRSLIYRNVDTPFSYADDYAIFPHMPMNTAGFDCRAPRILAEWMVSIPAERVKPELDEDAVPELLLDKSEYDSSPQPYVEVKAGEEGYEEAVDAALARLEEYRDGRRYAFCPDTSDVVDPVVTRGTYLVPPDTDILSKDGNSVIMPREGVPDRAHWVATDLTEVPGDWYPRRTDWAKVLIEHDPPELDPSRPDYIVKKAEQEAEMAVVDILDDVSLTDSFKTFANTPKPYGTWLEKEACDLSGQKKVADFIGDARMAWMDEPGQPQNARVFEATPGEMVYGMICVNCHGPKADAQGIQAKTVADLTGGDARVANFMTGLFGGTMPGANRERVFGGTAGANAETWGSRYMAWMALGGTQREIPDAVLDLVARTDVLGVPRSDLFIDGSANMLAVADTLCLYALPHKSAPFDLETAKSDVSQLIHQNGDAELWTEVCGRDNQAVVRVLYAGTDNGNWNAQTNAVELKLNASLKSGQGYPVGTAVGNQHGKVVTWSTPDANGAQPDNVFPWCIAKPTDATQKGFSDAFVQSHAVDGKPLPYCPDGLVALSDAERKAWTTRGAINAGFAVFQHLERLAQGAQPRRYDQCESLK